MQHIIFIFHWHHISTSQSSRTVCVQFFSLMMMMMMGNDGMYVRSIDDDDWVHPFSLIIIKCIISEEEKEGTVHASVQQQLFFLLLATFPHFLCFLMSNSLLRTFRVMMVLLIVSSADDDEHAVNWQHRCAHYVFMFAHHRLEKADTMRLISLLLCFYFQFFSERNTRFLSRITCRMQVGMRFHDWNRQSLCCVQ